MKRQSFVFLLGSDFSACFEQLCKLDHSTDSKLSYSAKISTTMTSKQAERLELEREAALNHKKILKSQRDSEQLEEDLKQYHQKLHEKEERLTMLAKQEKSLARSIGKDTNKIKSRYAKIDTLSDKVFDEFFESSNELRVRIIFEDEITELTVRDSITPRFRDLKLLIAQKYYLFEDDFFFSDSQDNIILDSLPIRHTIYSMNQWKLRNRVPEIKLILKGYRTYQGLLQDKIHTHQSENAQLTDRIPEILARAKSNSASARFSNFWKLWTMYKNLVILLLFLGLLVVITANTLNTRRFEEIHFFKGATEKLLQKLASEAQGIEVLIQRLGLLVFEDSLPLFRTSILLPFGRLLTQHYKTKDCDTRFARQKQEFYQQENLTCKDLNVDRNYGPLEVYLPSETIRLDYQYDSSPVYIRTAHRAAATNGYIHDFSFEALNKEIRSQQGEGASGEYPREINIMRQMANISTLQYADLMFSVLSPTLEMVAQVHIYEDLFNYDQRVLGVVVNVLNVQGDDQAKKTLIIITFVLTGLLLMINFFDVVRLVMRKDAATDTEILKKNQKTKLLKEKRFEEASSIQVTKFWTFDFHYVSVLVYPPTLAQAISIASICLILAAVSEQASIQSMISSTDMLATKAFVNLNEITLAESKVGIEMALSFVLIMFGIVERTVGFCQDFLPELKYYNEMVGKMMSEFKWLTPVGLLIVIDLAILEFSAFGPVQRVLTSFRKRIHVFDAINDGKRCLLQFWVLRSVDCC